VTVSLLPFEVNIGDTIRTTEVHGKVTNFGKDDEGHDYYVVDDKHLVYLSDIGEVTRHYPPGAA
jgi:hypothetical protein